MSENIVKYMLWSFVFMLLVGVIGIVIYLNSTPREDNTHLHELVMGTWVKLPGFCEGKVTNIERMEIISPESMMVDRKPVMISGFTLSETSPVVVNCQTIGQGELYAQTSFLGNRFTRLYIGSVGGYVVLKEVNPRGEFWFKYDQKLQEKLQAMKSFPDFNRI